MNNLFANISNQNLEKLLKLLRADTFTCKKGVSLSYLMNDNFVGIVLKGYLEVIKRDYEGHRSIIETLEPMQVFGTTISSLNSPDYDIETILDSKIILIDYNNILNFLEKGNHSYQKFLTNLLVIVTNKISEKNERIAILTQKSIRNKLLEYFKITSLKNNSRHIYIPTTYTELAEYLAVDRSAMSRELKNLQNEGFIDIKNKKITLLYETT